MMFYNDSGERICPLCTRTKQPGDKWTPEHTPPEWWGDFIAPLVPPEGVRMSHNGVPMGDGQYKTRATLTAEILQSCNAWLNAHVENPARELIKQLSIAAPTIRELTPGDQAHVARWLFKTDAIQSLALRRLTPLDSLRHLRATGDLPPSVTIWIGQAAADVVKGPTPQHLPSKSELVGAFPIPWGTWASSSRSYRLCALSVDKPSDPKWTVELPVELHGLFVRIWPPNEGVIGWAPSIVIDRPTAEALPSVFGPVMPAPFDHESEK